MQNKINSIVDWSSKNNSIFDEYKNTKNIISLFEDAFVAEEFQEQEELSLILSQLEDIVFFKDDYDKGDCFVTLQAHSGGLEATDFTAILDRMYNYWWSSKNFKIQEIDRYYKEGAGITEVSYKISGKNAYGHMKCEIGTHRLGRVSPFNAEGKKQTSFAVVDVVPDIKTSKLVIPNKDLKIVVFARSSGPGGQNVNKTATAVRITHIPTGIQVVASTYREMLQNKKQALQIMKSKLQKIEDDKQDSTLEKLRLKEKGRGTQIRSYFDYNNSVVDHRTDLHEKGIARIFDGNLDSFFRAELLRRCLTPARS